MRKIELYMQAAMETILEKKEMMRKQQHKQMIYLQLRNNPDYNGEDMDTGITFTNDDGTL